MFTISLDSNNGRVLRKNICKKNILYKIYSRKMNCYFEFNTNYYIPVIKICTKKNLKYHIIKGEYESQLNILEQKTYDDFLYLIKHKKISIDHFFKDSCELFDTETVSFLLSLSSDINCQMALQKTCWREDDNAEMVMIIVDYQLEQEKNSKYISGKKNGSICSKLNFKQPLLNAIERGNYNVVKLLIDYGANPILDKIVNLAVSEGHIDVAELLVSHKAKYKVNVHNFMLLISQQKSQAEMIEFVYNYYIGKEKICRSLFERIINSYNLNNDVESDPDSHSDSDSYSDPDSDSDSDSDPDPYYQTISDSDYDSDSDSDSNSDPYSDLKYITGEELLQELMSRALILASESGSIDTIIAIIDCDLDLQNSIQIACTKTKNKNKQIYDYLNTIH